MLIVQNRIAAVFLAASIASSSCHALVGESLAEGPMAPHVLMILARGHGVAGFCTGVVIAPDVVLTAAHCVATASDTLVYVKSAEPPLMLEPRTVAKHPDYKPDALRKRERSIDLALIRTASALPAPLRSVQLGKSEQVKIGQHFGIAGFGVTKEGQGSSAGTLRWGELRTREPLSKILLWAEDPAARGFGACEGDSGGPVYDLQTGALVAITSWSEGAGAQHCGKLTQAALLAPQRAWIDGVLRGWGVAR